MLKRILKALSDSRPQDSPIGKYATVTTHGDIPPRGFGEVRVELWGGTEYFHAKSANHDAIKADEEVVIVDYEPPRTVIVARATD